MRCQRVNDSSCPMDCESVMLHNIQTWLRLTAIKSYEVPRRSSVAVEFTAPGSTLVLVLE